MNQPIINKGEQRRKMMLEGNIVRVVIMVALPQIITMLIDSFYNITDTYFVSHLGPAATAAVGINDSTMHIIRAIALAFGMGAASYISRLLGAQQDREASQVASTTIFTAMGFIAIISSVAYIFLSPLMTFMGSTPNSKPYSMAYAKWTFFFAPFTGGTVCLSQTLRSEGSTIYSMMGMVIGCTINLFLDPLFIWVLNWGVAGAAIATGISKVISFGVLLWPYISRRSIIRLSPKLFAPGRVIYGEIARMGVPVGLRSSMMAVANIVINNFAAGFGDAVLAAVAVANKSMKLVASAILGLGQGFQPIAGYCWGAQKYERVKKAFFVTSALGIIFSIITGIILFIFAPRVLAIFTTDSDMLAAGIILIRSQCIVLPMHLLVIISAGLFQGTGNAFQAGVLGLSRQLVSLLPCVIILTMLFGLNGLVRAQALADVFSFCIAMILVIPMIFRLNRLQKSGGCMGETIT
jgi:putative MATE family efflux protein